MSLDNITALEIDSFFDYYSQRAASPATISAGAKVEEPAIPTVAHPSSVDDAIRVAKLLPKYKSLKKLLPEAALRQKMMLDNIPEAEIDAYIAYKEPVTPAASTPAASTTPVEWKLSKYKSMRAVLPEEALRQKMRLDDIPETDINAFFNTKISPPKLGGAAPAASAAKKEFGKYDALKDKMATIVKAMMIRDGFSNADIDKVLVKQ